MNDSVNKAAIQTFTVIIPANGTSRVDFPGNYVRLRSLTGVTEINVRREESAILLPMKDSNQMTFNGEYSYLLFENPNGSQATVEVIMGYGKFEAQEISGTVTIDSSSGDVNVDDDATRAAINDVLAMLQNADDQRAGHVDLTNASYASVNNATTTVVSAASNVNGVIVRTCSLRTGGTGDNCLLRVGTGEVIARIGGTHDSAYLTNVFVPAGKDVILQNAQGTSYADMAYEVL